MLSFLTDGKAKGLIRVHRKGVDENALAVRPITHSCSAETVVLRPWGENKSMVTIQRCEGAHPWYPAQQKATYHYCKFPHPLPQSMFVHINKHLTHGSTLIEVSAPGCTLDSLRVWHQIGSASDADYTEVDRVITEALLQHLACIRQPELQQPAFT